MKTQIKRIFIPAPLNPGLKKTVETVKKLCAKKGLIVVAEHGDADLTIVVGGDGSLLNALSQAGYPDTPFVGISGGTLGFLQEIESNKTADLLDCIISGQYRLTAFPLLEYSCGDTSGVAFNEVVIERASAQTSHLAIAVNGVVFDKFIGDGLIISTPQGSSAYALAAGGAFLSDGLGAMQLVPVNPHNTVAYRSLHSPLILPLTASVEVTNLDGQHRPVRILADGIENAEADVSAVTIKRSRKKAILLRTKNYDYYRMLARKFVK